jgi:hypothetical protein
MNILGDIDVYKCGLAYVFNASFNNISAISWWSVLLEEEIGVPGENHYISVNQDHVEVNEITLD